MVFWVEYRRLIENLITDSLRYFQPKPIFDGVWEDIHFFYGTTYQIFYSVTYVRTWFSVKYERNWFSLTEEPGSAVNNGRFVP